jgi:hypothetical protein
VSDDPVLRTLGVPAGTFRQARLPKSRRVRGSSGHPPRPSVETLALAHAHAMDTADSPTESRVSRSDSTSGRRAHHHHHHHHSHGHHGHSRRPARMSWGDDGSGGHSGSSSEDDNTRPPSPHASTSYTLDTATTTSPITPTSTTDASARPRTFAAAPSPEAAQHWWAPARPDLPPLGFRGGPPPRRQPVDDAMLQRLHGSTVDVLMCAS